MDEGRSVYFGPWNAAAQQLLSKYLPVSHVLAAGGNAEQPRDVKKAAKKADDKKVSRHSWHTIISAFCLCELLGCILRS